MRFPLIVAVVAMLTCGLTLSLRGQQTHRNAFESRQMSWQKGSADVAFREQLHEMTNQTSHHGQQSERVQVAAEQGAQGSYVYYLYPVGRANLVEELTIKVWVRGNRPGIQLLARLVLPRERDPKDLSQPLTTILRGDTYHSAGRWFPLEIRRPVRLAQQQQQLMRIQFQRPDVNFEDAYIDQLMLNVYGGPGVTDVWIDDLEISPVAEDPSQQPNAAPGQLAGSPSAPPPSPRYASIQLNQDRLQVNKQPFLIRGLRHSDTPLETLRDAGFNALWVDYNTREEVLQEAVNLGFWLVPVLPVLEDNNPRMSPAGLSREVARFPHMDAVLAWDIGGGLAAEQAEAIGRAATTIRAADPYQGRPVAGDTWDGFQAYSRHLDMLGVHRWPLMTGLELGAYREWLVQRRYLSRPGSYIWTWVQTHLPDWYTTLVYDRPGSEAFDEPIGPHPEQIRLLTYLALSAGYRGLGFWSDRFLANSHHGRDRLLMLALVNQELDMLEPLLAKAARPEWVSTKHPEIKAALFRYDGGALVFLIWLGKGAQFVPGQLATNNLEVVVPEVPQDAQVWEVSPGHVRSLKRERVAGGIKVIVPEFGLTTALVFTSDVNAIARLQDGAAKTRKLAAQWSYELALEELAKVEKIHFQLESLGHALPFGRQRLDETRERLNAAREAWQSGLPSGHREAYLEAQRAMRPLRILMRAHWDAAVKPLDSPVASPFAVSFFTLPKHWLFMEEVRAAQAGNNLLTHGDFELALDQTWSAQEVTLDEVELIPIRRVSEQPKEGRQCLKLEVRPRDVKAPPAALERTFLAAQSPPLQLQPGSIVRISGWVKIPQPIQASTDGVLFFDSVGGEPLAVRLTHATDWRKFTLYRQVPPSGSVSVTLALTGIGTAYFDDIRVEPLLRSRPAPQVTGAASGALTTPYAPRR